MSNTILLKRSTTLGAIPALTDLQQGEISTNLSDKLIYLNGPGGVFAIGQYSRLKNAGVHNSSYSASPFELVGIDSTGNVISVRLPENPPAGCIVGVIDIGNQIATNPARVYSTNEPVAGNAGGIVLNQNGTYIEFYHFGSSKGWIVTSQITSIAGSGLPNLASWTQYEIDTWSTSAATLGTETLTWGNI